MQKIFVIESLASCVPSSNPSKFCDSNVCIVMVTWIEPMTCLRWKSSMKTMLLIPSMKKIFKNIQKNIAFIFC